MAQDASQRWNRTDGVLIAPGTTPEAVADAFASRGVVVRLEWFPATTSKIGRASCRERV